CNVIKTQIGQVLQTSLAWRELSRCKSPSGTPSAAHQHRSAASGALMPAIGNDSQGCDGHIRLVLSPHFDPPVLSYWHVLQLRLNHPLRRISRATRFKSNTAGDTQVH